MTAPDIHSQDLTDEDFRTQAQRYVDDFLKLLMIYPSLAVTLVFYPTRKDYEADRRRKHEGPIYKEKDGSRFTLHVCRELLPAITPIALQGWLEHELGLCAQMLQPEFYTINFKQKIFPLMPVTGSAEYIMLELMEHLEAGFKRHLVTRTLLEMGHGLPQAHFYYYRINPEADDHKKYKRAIPHPWSMALLLCARLKEYLPIALLSRMHIDFSHDLEAYWWKVHEYMLPGDRMFLKLIADDAAQQEKTDYPDRIVSMFKLARSHYLNFRQTKPSSKPVIH